MADLDYTIEPFRPLLKKDIIQAEKESEIYNENISFGDVISASYQEDNMMSYIFRDNPEYEPDPDFVLDDQTYDEITKDIPEEYRGFVVDAVSNEHAYELRNRVLQSMENEKTMAGYGWGSVPVRVAMSILDPAAIGVSVATEGALAPAVWAGKATRLSRAFRGATGAAASNAAIEAYLVSQNETKDPYDILYAATAGLFLGGGIGYVRGAKPDEFTQALGKVSNDVHKAQVSDTAQVVKTRMGSEDTIVDASDIDRGVGAAENPMSRPVQIDDLRTDMDDYLADVGDPETSVFGKARFDMTGMLKQSAVRGIRYFGNILGEDAVGFNKGGEALEATADIIKTNGMKGTLAQYYRIYEPAYREWAKENGIGYFKSKFGSSRQQFGNLVGQAIEQPGLPVSPAVRRAADVQAKLFADMLGEAKRVEVKGFDAIPEDLTYFTHLWDGFKFQSLGVRYGTNKIEALLKVALSRGMAGVEEEITEKIAKNMTKKLRKKALGMESGLARAFTTDSKDILRDILVEEEILEQVDADRLISLLETRPEGISPRAKRRLKIDINAAIDVGDGNILRVTDLMQRDAEQVFTQYVTQMWGRIALAQKGIRSEADYTRLVDRARAEAGDLGLVEEDIAGDLQTVDVLYNMILGRSSPLVDDPTGTFPRIARLVQDYNFIRLMNQVGFAQVAELGNALALGGWRGVLQNVPEMRRMLKRARNGELEDDVLNEIEAAEGIGADRMIHQAMNRYDAQDLFVEGRGDWIDKASFAIQPVKRVVADLSGMAPITLALERLAARVAVQKITDLAFSARTMSVKRIRGLGLDDDMANRVFSQIRDNATTTESMLFRNRKIRKINLAEWADEDARDAFLVAISRMTRQSIQQNDLGNLNKYMTTTMGKLITQFRTFMLVSYSKQFLHHLAARDAQAALGMTYSVAFAGLSYVAQQQVNAIGREDADEFLEQRLEPMEIAKAAFQRSSWANFIPAMVDTGAALVKEDPIFAYGRTTGIASNLVQGIPTVDLGEKVFETVSGAFGSLVNEDFQWSKGQQRAVNSLLPLQNALGIKQGLNKLVEIAPETSRVD